MSEPRRASSAFAILFFTSLLALPAPLFLAGCGDVVTCDNCGDSSGTGSSSGSGSWGARSRFREAQAAAGRAPPGRPSSPATGRSRPGRRHLQSPHNNARSRYLCGRDPAPFSPLGTHHTVLAIGSLSTDNTLYASGVGTNKVMFPKGVGLKIPAGELIVLQLHVFNTSAEALSGTSGIEIIEVPAAEIEQSQPLPAWPVRF